jgi:ribosomal protein S18 acetylase RimI-like enzyme
VVRSSGRALKAGPWPGDAEATALLTPFGGDLPPTTTMVSSALRDLERAGYRRVLTAALGVHERQVFLAAGFAPVEWLHVLSRTLDDLPPAPPAGLRRVRRTEWDRVAEIDAQAFAPLWRLDAAGITEARRATPSNRMRVACDASNRPIGYGVAGRSGLNGYIQRVAVAPEAEGHGAGTALVVDGLRWLRARGATSALINTQLNNQRALHLYLRLGFCLQEDRLVVLGTQLGAAA